MGRYMVNRCVGLAERHHLLRWWIEWRFVRLYQISSIIVGQTEIVNGISRVCEIFFGNKNAPRFFARAHPESKESIGAQARIERVPQSIAEEVESKHRQHDCQPREQKHPPGSARQIFDAIGEHGAPFGIGRLLPQT